MASFIARCFTAPYDDRSSESIADIDWQDTLRKSQRVREELPLVSHCKSQLAPDMKIMRWKLEAVVGEAEANRRVAEAAMAREAAAYAKIKLLEGQLEATRRERDSALAAATRASFRLLEATRPAGDALVLAQAEEAPAEYAQDSAEPAASGRSAQHEEGPAQPASSPSAPAESPRSCSTATQREAQPAPADAPHAPLLTEEPRQRPPAQQEAAPTPWSGGVFASLSLRRSPVTARTPASAARRVSSFPFPSSSGQSSPSDLSPALTALPLIPEDQPDGEVGR